MTSKLKAHAALVGTNLFFAINYTAIKYLVNGHFIQPFGLNIIRACVTMLIFWLMFLFKRTGIKIARKDYGRFFLCALTGIAVNQLLFVKGLSLTYSIHASLLMLVTPIFITFMAAWILKERLNIYKLIGLGLGISGALVLILAKEKTGNPSEVLFGDILVMLNAISYAVYIVMVKPLMRDYNAMQVLRIIFTLGFLMMLPFCLNDFQQTDWSLFGTKEILTLILIVVGGTFLAYIFNIYGIKILGASAAGAYIYSQPVFAAVISMLFLGEHLAAYKIFAGLLIFAGVYLANKKQNNA